jgi:hypothetical protein
MPEPVMFRVTPTNRTIGLVLEHVPRRWVMNDGLALLAAWLMFLALLAALALVILRGGHKR